METKCMLRVADVAPRLGLSTRRIYQLISAGRLPAVRDGQSVRIPTTAFDQWLRDQAEEALSAIRSKRAS